MQEGERLICVARCPILIIVHARGFWVPSKDSVFSVAYFFSIVAEDNLQISPLGSIWKLKAPRILVFGWLTLRGSILTLDNLSRRNVVIVNGCPLCISAEEHIAYKHT